MGFLRRLFGGSDESSDDDGAQGADDLGDGPGTPLPEDRQQLTVWVRLFDPAFENEREQARVFGIENELIRALDASGAGTFDTNDLQPGYLGIQLLGVDADAMLLAVRPVLADAPSGSYLAVRRGPSGASEERLEIADD